MNGGGFGPDGWQHEHFDCVSHFPTVDPIPGRHGVDSGKTKQQMGIMVFRTAGTVMPAG